MATADLVLVDYFVAQHWTEADEVLSASRRPMDGLAVISTLRSALVDRTRGDSVASANAKPVAFALISSNLAAATAQLPVELRDHAFARFNNIEWAFERTSLAPGSALRSRVTSLAAAVQRLPDSWLGQAGFEKAEERLLALLGLDMNQPWGYSALRSVNACRPPLHEMSERSHGLATLRWLAHRILPYPTFLWDDHNLALRLRTSVSDVRQARDERRLGPLADLAYKGALHDFSGQRWWRRGIESWLWDVTAGRANEPSAVRDAVDEHLGISGSEHPLNANQVVVIDEAYVQQDDFVDMDDAVRVEPDDWPIFADPAWATIASVQGSAVLAALVSDYDRERARIASGGRDD